MRDRANITIAIKYEAMYLSSNEAVVTGVFHDIYLERKREREREKERERERNEAVVIVVFHVTYLNCLSKTVNY